MRPEVGTVGWMWVVWVRLLIGAVGQVWVVWGESCRWRCWVAVGSEVLGWAL